MISTQEQEVNPTPSIQVDIPIPKDAEQVPEETVRQLVSEIVIFYNLPSEVQAKGINSRVYKVSKKELPEIALKCEQKQRSRQGEDVSLKNLEEEHKQELRDFLNMDKKPHSANGYRDISLEELISAQGFCFPLSADQSYIFIDRDLEGFSERRAIRHELLHAMSNYSLEKGIGFYNARSYQGHVLNEAVTEILEIYQRREAFYKNKLSDIQKIGYGTGNNESPYVGYLQKIGFLLGMVEQSGKQVTIQDLAGIYFAYTMSPAERVEKLSEEFKMRSGQMNRVQTKVFGALFGIQSNKPSI